MDIRGDRVPGPTGPSEGAAGFVPGEQPIALIAKMMRSRSVPWWLARMACCWARAGTATSANMIRLHMQRSSRCARRAGRSETIGCWAARST